MLTVVIGGASSGKSEAAENICMSFAGRKAYVATMIPFGEGANGRILRHLALRRGKGMDTIEKYTDIGDLGDRVSEYEVILIECMTNLVANEQFRPDAASETDIALKIRDDILRLTSACENIVVVTCDVFRDGGAYAEETIAYMRNLGKLNRELIKEADRVVEVFYGLAQDIKS